MGSEMCIRDRSTFYWTWSWCARRRKFQYSVAYIGPSGCDVEDCVIRVRHAVSEGEDTACSGACAVRGAGYVAAAVSNVPPLMVMFSILPRAQRRNWVTLFSIGQYCLDLNSIAERTKVSDRGIVSKNA